MALVLDPTLQTAQDGQTHRPILELTSHNPVASIPFDGYKISGLSAETEPKLIMTSTGRLVYVYIYNGNPYMGYSDVDRTQWYNGNALNTDSNYTCTSIDCCEMTDGNIAIVLTLAHKTSTAQYVQGMVYTPVAVLVSGRSTAFNWTTNENDYGITLKYDGSNYRWILGAYSGSTYYFRTGTSADMVTWNTATTFVPATLSNTTAYRNPYLFFPDNDNPILVFDYIESYSAMGEPLSNLYLMESTDGGVTWQTPTAITAYTSYDTIGSQPAVSQTTEDSLLLTFKEESPTLYMSRDATGWSPQAGGTYPEDYAGGIAFDPTTRKIYHVSQGTYAVNKALWGVTQIDLDSWTADDYWDTTSTPYLARGSGQIYHSNRTATVYGSKFIFVLGNTTVAIIDPVTNTIKYWAFHDGYGQTQNVNWTDTIRYGTEDKPYNVTSIDIGDDGTVYVLAIAITGTKTPAQICTLNIDDPGPTYTVDTLLMNSENIGDNAVSNNTVYRVFEDAGYVVTSISDYAHNHKFSLFALSSSAITFIKEYYCATAAYNLYDGEVKDFYCEGGYIYLAINGSTGLYKFSIADEFATHIVPPETQSPAFTIVDYDPTLRALMCTGDAGLFVYYLDTDEWGVYNALTVSGITPYGGDNFVNAVYDSVNDGFIVGINDRLLTPQGEGGILFIPRSGNISQIKYATGTESSGWTFDTPEQLVTDYSAADMTTAYVDGSTEFYALWVDENSQDDTSSLTWDKNESSAELTDHIVRDAEVSITPNIAGSPSVLSFQLGNGHLFDDFNLASMLRPYVKKGRKLALRLGETVGSTEYLINQGSYYVEQKSIEYMRGGKMIMRVTALDKLSQLQELEISATEYLSNVAASLAYKAFAEDLGAVDSAAEIAGTPFISDETLSAQFIDMTLYEILYTLAWRYGCMPRYDFDGYLDAVRVPGSTVSHAYSDNAAVVKFTPDDSYGDKTNKVIVEGEYPDLTEVVHSEELVGQIAGSVGWWGDAETYRIYYSEDQERRVLNPRLKVLSSAESIPLRLAGSVDEYISYEDPDNKFVDVKVDAPNLTAALVAALAGYGAGVWIGDETTFPGAPTIPIGKPIAGASLLIAAQILGSVASFQYEIWGQPLGYVTRTIQEKATDDENIAYVGKTFPKTITGYNCDSTADCLAVAKREIVIAKAQRNRVVILKKAHLQDEPGDLISIKHPISGQVMEICIVEMKRTYQQGSGFFDILSGWVMS